MIHGFRLTAKEEGFRALARGWAPTFIGYSMQGLCKFGFYEVFKILYSNMLGEVRHIENVALASSSISCIWFIYCSTSWKPWLMSVVLKLYVISGSRTELSCRIDHVLIIVCFTGNDVPVAYKSLPRSFS